MNNIQVGKFYKTRAGTKVRIYVLDGIKPYSVHGAHQVTDGGWSLTSWTSEGMYRNSFPILGDNDLDIVSEWVDKPIFDWSIQSPWFKYAAMDYNGHWFLFDDKPVRALDRWMGGGSTFVPTAYAPTFKGDWKDSLIQRP